MSSTIFQTNLEEDFYGCKIGN